MVRKPLPPALDVSEVGEEVPLAAVAAGIGQDEIRDAVVGMSRPGYEVVDLALLPAELEVAVEA